MTYTEIIVLDALEHSWGLAKELLNITKRRKKRFNDAIPKIDLLEKTFLPIIKYFPQNKTVIERVEAFNRHLWFVKRYIGTDRHKLVPHNLRDIVEFDIPIIRNEFKNHIMANPSIHPRFREECGDLIAVGEFDSVIRKGFVIIRELAKRRFPLLEGSQIDGINLMQKLFDNNSGLIRVHTEKDKQGGFRDIAKGLYAWARNDEMHNLRDRPVYEIECIMMLINQIMFSIDNQQVLKS
ncbi:MAG TPA: TIGR02391 family protein [Nitrospiria bacterium]|jgi:hypothetical protein